MTASLPAKAAVLRSSDAPFRIEDVQIELPRADELLVRLVATGICHSDMVMRDQGLPTPQPVVLGHEGAGIVEQVGAAITHVRPGDHVVLAFNSCGHCPSCNDHAPSYCFEFFPRNFMGTRPDGSSPLTSDTGMIYANIFGQSSFATRAIARGRNAVKVAKDAPLELLGPLGCGVMTGAGAVMNALDVLPGSSLAVFGAGAVGLSAVMAAKAVGAKTIIAIDLNESRLSLARELGATETLVGSTIGLAAAVTDAAAGTLNYAIDTTGRPDVIRVAADALGPRGVLGLVGANAPGDEISFDAVSIMSGGRMVRGVVEGDADPHTFIPKLIALHAKGLFPFDRLIKFYPFEDINTAFRDGEDGRTVKPVLKISSPI
jgi:aryl-alcohol dehydrogenase